MRWVRLFFSLKPTLLNNPFVFNYSRRFCTYYLLFTVRPRNQRREFPPLLWWEWLVRWDLLVWLLASLRDVAKGHQQLLIRRSQWQTIKHTKDPYHNMQFIYSYAVMIVYHDGKCSFTIKHALFVALSLPDCLIDSCWLLAGSPHSPPLLFFPSFFFCPWL